MSKDRDGFSDDDNLAPGAPGAEGVPSVGSTPAGPGGGAAAGDADVLHDPETTEPDALEVEAEIEAAEESAGLEPGTSDDASAGRVASADRVDEERAENPELVAAGVGRGSRGRRGSTPVVVTDKKDAPTKSRDAHDGEGALARLSRFLREVVAELRKVIWPSRKQMVTYTVVVIVFLIVMVALVSGLDVLFHFVVQEVLG